MSGRRVGRRTIILVVICLAASAGNVWRAASWPRPAVRGYWGFVAPASHVDGRVVRWAHGYAKVEVTSMTWRPLRVRLQLHGSPGNVPLKVAFAAEDHPLGQLDAQPGWQDIELVVVSAPARHERFDIQLFSTLDQSGSGVGVGETVVEPIFAWRPLAAHAAAGAVGGALAFLLFLPMRSRAPDRARPTEEATEGRRRRQREVAVVYLATLLVLGTWALVIPPYQVPDEPQHALRAASVRKEPWVSGGDAFDLDERYLNPIAKKPGVGLGKLFFHGERFLTLSDIRGLELRSWSESTRLTADERTERWAAASYPTLYHLVVFALGESATRLLGLTPYQSTYAYRLGSVLVASGLWAFLFRDLRRSSLAPMAPAMLAFLVMNPMLAFVSAGVNPDAFALPLCAVAMLAYWPLIETGSGAKRASVLLLAAALTKPSGLVLGLAVACAACCLWVFRAVSAERAWRVVRSVGHALVAAFVLFYAWSRPRFTGAGPMQVSVGEWALHLRKHAPDYWTSFWGQLGWLDYQLPGLWYTVLLWSVVVSALCVLVRPADRRASTALGLAFLAYVAIVVLGEYVSMREVGYNLQGRHLLPAALGLSAILLHRVPVVRWGLIGLVILMHVALFRQTFVRYYADDWGTFLAALPPLQSWDLPSDVPVPGNYIGAAAGPSACADDATFRPALGEWFIRDLCTGVVAIAQWGQEGDILVPADYDNDGLFELGVWRPSNGAWYIENPEGTHHRVVAWGQTGDVPLAGNFVGDGRADFVVWRPSSGTWFRRDGKTGTSDAVTWGMAGDVPIPVDCDEPPDGRLDLALWRPSTSTWHILDDDGVTARATFVGPRTATCRPPAQAVR